MNNIINIEIENGELKVYPDEGIIYHKVHKSMTEDEFQILLNKGLEILIQYDCHKWLSDDREMSFEFSEQSKRDMFVWEAKITKKGWKAWAIVLKNYEGKIVFTKSKIGRNRELGVKIEIFDNVDKAMEWLVAQ